MDLWVRKPSGERRRNRRAMSHQRSQIGYQVDSMKPTAPSFGFGSAEQRPVRVPHPLFALPGGEEGADIEALRNGREGRD